MHGTNLWSIEAMTDTIFSTQPAPASLCVATTLRISTMAAGSGSSAAISGVSPASCSCERWSVELALKRVIALLLSGEGGLGAADWFAAFLTADGSSLSREHK